MRVFAFASSLAFVALVLAPGCSSTPQPIGLIPDGGGNSGGDGGGSCAGSAPLCFGSNVLLCCGQDPAGNAVCQGGQWTCGGAPAPGCDGTSCLAQDAGAPQDGSTADVWSGQQPDSGGCTGSAPLCFGADLQSCCPPDPSGNATCVSGAWMCGSVAAPGCNGVSCIHPQDAGGNDAGHLPDGGCAGTAPLCFGSDITMCCGQDPAGFATCVGGAWMCGPAPAPGCDGLKCLALDSGAD